MDTQKLSDFIEQNGIATDAEITLVTHINGWSVESLNDIIFERTGFHDAQQLYDCDEPYDYSMIESYLVAEDDDDDDEGDDD